jgi:peptide subunit release factor 1 (eRF1)
MVLFFMQGCSHCAANQPAWEDACRQMKEKDPGIAIEEHESREAEVMNKEGVSSFPTMKLKEGDKEGVLVGKQSSGEDIVAKLESDLGKKKKKKGGSRQRRTHRRRHSRARKLIHRTLRNYVGLR